MNIFSRLFPAILLLFIFAVAPTIQSQAQILDAVEAAIKAAIMAIDLGVQKAQNATLDLQDAEKEIEDDLSQTQLGQIAGWEQQQKDIYSEYFDELWKVKTVISYFRQITGIISQQAALVTQYKTAYAEVQQDPHFTPQEVSYMYGVYSGIIAQSVKSVNQILLILQPDSLQMSDADRLKIISRASGEISKQTLDLQNFNDHNIKISMQRSSDLNDINAVKALYGVAD